jgi:chaperonin cofactor prefoldin
VVNAEEFKKLAANREKLRDQAETLITRLNEVRKQTETLAERIARRKLSVPQLSLVA